MIGENNWWDIPGPSPADLATPSGEPQMEFRGGGPERALRAEERRREVTQALSVYMYQHGVPNDVGYEFRREVREWSLYEQVSGAPRHVACGVRHVGPHQSPTSPYAITEFDLLHDRTIKDLVRQLKGK